MIPIMKRKDPLMHADHARIVKQIINNMRWHHRSNILLVGNAGVGKSFIVKMVKEKLSRKYDVLSCITSDRDVIVELPRPEGRGFPVHRSEPSMTGLTGFPRA